MSTSNLRFCHGLEHWAERADALRHVGSQESGKILVAGWFSFEAGAATAGDLMARDVTCEWLRSGGYSYDIALAASLGEGVDWRAVDPQEYSDVVFVCGPFGRNPLSLDFLERFRLCRKIGLNLSMTEPLNAWNPFDVLLERDSSITARPELAFACRQRRVPVVGVIPVESIAEYPDRAMHNAANAAIRRLLAAREAAIVEIDTRLPLGLTGLRSAREVESLIARMDLVVTTRLHGMVLALKNGVPAVAIDPHAGGSKVLRQATTISWSAAFDPAVMDDEALLRAFDYCLTDQARSRARACAENAITELNSEKDCFLQHLDPPLRSEA